MEEPSNEMASAPLLPAELQQKILQQQIVNECDTLNEAMNLRLVSKQMKDWVDVLLRKKTQITIDTPPLRRYPIMKIMQRVKEFCPDIRRIVFREPPIGMCDSIEQLSDKHLKLLQELFPLVTHVTIPRSSRITDEGCETTIAMLPCLESLDVTCSMKLGPSVVVHVATKRQETLKYLRVRPSPVRWHAMLDLDAAKALGQCLALRSLDLQSCRLTAEMVMHILRCKTLCHVNMSQNPGIDDAGLKWPLMPTLRSLDLQECSLNLAALEKIKLCCPNLTTFLVRGNGLTADDRVPIMELESKKGV